MRSLGGSERKSVEGAEKVRRSNMIEKSAPLASL